MAGSLEVPVRIDDVLKVEQVSVINALSFDNLRVLLEWLAANAKAQSTRLDKVEEDLKNVVLKNEIEKLWEAVNSQKVQQAAADAQRKAMEDQISELEKGLKDKAAHNELSDLKNLPPRVDALEKLQEGEAKKSSEDEKSKPSSDNGASKRSSENGRNSSENGKNPFKNGDSSLENAKSSVEVGGNTSESARSSSEGEKSKDPSEEGALRDSGKSTSRKSSMSGKGDTNTEALREEIGKLADVAEEEKRRLDDAEQKMAELQEKLEKQAALVAQHASQIESHNDHLRTHNQNLERHGEDISDLQKTCKSLRSELEAKPIAPPNADVSTDPNALSAAITTLQKRLESKVDKDDIVALEKSVDRIAQDVKGLREDVNGLKRGVDDVRGGLEKVESKQGEVDLKVAGLETGGALSRTLTTRQSTSSRRPVSQVDPSKGDTNDGVQRGLDALTDRISELEASLLGMSRTRDDDQEALETLREKCSRLEDDFKSLMPSIEERLLQKANHSTIDELTFKINLLSSPEAATSAPRPPSQDGAGHRRSSVSSGALDALKDMVGKKADRDEVQRLLKLLETQRVELLKEIRVVADRDSKATKFASLEELAALAKQQKEQSDEIDALRRALTAKADRSALDAVLATSASKATAAVLTVSPAPENSTEAGDKLRVVINEHATRITELGDLIVKLQALLGSKAEASALEGVVAAVDALRQRSRRASLVAGLRSGPESNAVEAAVREWELNFAMLQQKVDELARKAGDQPSAGMLDNVARFSTRGSAGFAFPATKMTEREATPGGVEALAVQLQDMQRSLQQLYRHLGLLNKGTAGFDSQGLVDVNGQRSSDVNETLASSTSLESKLARVSRNASPLSANSGGPEGGASRSNGGTAGAAVPYEEILRAYEEWLTANKENAGKIGGQKFAEMESLLSRLQEQIASKAERSDLQKLARLLQEYLARKGEGDYAMLAGKPLLGYKCMSCDHPLERLNSKRAEYVPTGNLPKSTWPLQSADRIYNGGLQGQSPPRSPHLSPRAEASVDLAKGTLTPPRTAQGPPGMATQNELLPPLKERKGNAMPSPPAYNSARRSSGQGRRSINQENGDVF